MNAIVCETCRRVIKIPSKNVKYFELKVTEYDPFPVNSVVRHYCPECSKKDYHPINFLLNHGS